MRRPVALAAALACCACVPAGRLAREQAAAPVFDPLAFFAGRTRGVGVLSVMFRGRQRTVVDGRGRISPDGAVTLDQTVTRGDGPPTRREWRLRRIGPGRYAGTLTDATGPVIGKVLGNRLHLAFAMRGGLHAEQWLYLQPGGRVARNRMVVKKLGLPVASLDETITRVQD